MGNNPTRTMDVPGAILRLPEPPWIVAHRGASETRPENTLASFRQALAECAHMIELDLQLTTDGEIVAVHDWIVEVSGRRRTVEESTLADLRPEAGKGEEELFPPLDEVLELIPAEVPLNLEIKRRSADLDTWVKRLAGALGERGNVLVSSFDWDLLGRVRQAMPERPVAPIGSRQPHALLRAAETLDAWSVHCHRRLAFSDFLSAARSARWPVLVYTVNDVELAGTLIDRGASGLFTDAPGRLLAALTEADIGEEEE